MTLSRADWIRNEFDRLGGFVSDDEMVQRVMGTYEYTDLITFGEQRARRDIASALGYRVRDLPLALKVDGDWYRIGDRFSTRITVGIARLLHQRLELKEEQAGWRKNRWLTWCRENLGEEFSLPVRRSTRVPQRRRQAS